MRGARMMIPDGERIYISMSLIKTHYIDEEIGSVFAKTNEIIKVID